jgi:hypothetical protein
MDAEGYIDKYGVDEYEAHVGEGRCFRSGGWKGRRMGRSRSRLIHGNRRSESQCPNISTDGQSGMKEIERKGYIEGEDEDVPFASFLQRCILDDIPFPTSPLGSDLPELQRL